MEYKIKVGDLHRNGKPRAFKAACENWNWTGYVIAEPVKNFQQGQSAALELYISDGDYVILVDDAGNEIERWMER